MSLYDSPIYLNDLDKVVAIIPFWRELKGRSVLITGASGLIGSAVVDLLMRANEELLLQCHVYVAGRNQVKADERFKKYIESSYYHFVPYDATDHVVFQFRVDYVIHAASNAYPSIYQQYPVETMLDNFTGLYELLNYARSVDAKRVLFVSSSEIYGVKESARANKEDEYGYIDALTVKACYANSKRAAETLCVSFSSEYHTETVIVRPGHIYGPTASRTDSRVSSAFAYAAADGKEIVMKSSGTQIRSYCYMLDAASAILTVLIKGQSADAYNISNEESVISIREMAQNQEM